MIPWEGAAIYAKTEGSRQVTRFMSDFDKYMLELEENAKK